VNAVLLKPLPFPQPERLLTLDHFYPSLNNLEAGFAVPSYHDIRERTRSFESFAVVTGWNANLTGGGDPEKVNGSNATSEYFKVFGVSPLLGRTFAPGEDSAGREHVVVLGYGLWAAPLRIGQEHRGPEDPAQWRAVRRDRRMPEGFDGFSIGAPSCGRRSCSSRISTTTTTGPTSS
jgi:hypothetical protein